MYYSNWYTVDLNIITGVNLTYITSTAHMMGDFKIKQATVNPL